MAKRVAEYPSGSRETRVQGTETDSSAAETLGARGRCRAPTRAALPVDDRVGPGACVDHEHLVAVIARPRGTIRAGRELSVQSKATESVWTTTSQASQSVNDFTVGFCAATKPG